MVGRATESQETDIVRLAYRHPLPQRDAWWMPTHAQFGGSGRVRRLPAFKDDQQPRNARAPAFEFGSHVGIGFALTKNQSLGIAVQHLSNAGLKQPNGGIDLLLVQYTISTGTPTGSRGAPGFGIRGASSDTARRCGDTSTTDPPSMIAA